MRMPSISVHFRVSFGTMGKGGKNNTYKKSGGKGSVHHSMLSRWSRDMGKVQLMMIMFL